LLDFLAAVQRFNLILILSEEGARGSLVVKALAYKPEGRGSETQ
jgi:hypothetical protein